MGSRVVVKWAVRKKKSGLVCIQDNKLILVCCIVKFTIPGGNKSTQTGII